MLNAGDALFVAGVQSHLWIVITDPVGSNCTIVMVNMTSVKDDGPRDPSCVIRKGEHPFVRHDTEINYQQAREVDCGSESEFAAKQQFFQPAQSVSTALLRRIQDGALESRFMKKRFQDVVRQQLKK